MERRTGMLVMLLVLMLAVPSSTLLADAAAGAGPGGGGSRASWTVDRFEESTVPVDVGFILSRENSTYHLSAPNSATITSASLTLEGVQRYSLKGTPTDFSDNPSASHSGYTGSTKQYPPSSSPSNIIMNSQQVSTLDESLIERRDGSVLITQTSFMNAPPPHEHPYHIFDMLVNKSGMVRLEVEWVGYGFCGSNKTNTHGAELWIWNFTDTGWERLSLYGMNDTADNAHLLARTLFHPYPYTSKYGHVYLMAMGQQDERHPIGGTDTGRVSTDYTSVTVLVNDTIQHPRSVEVAIGDQPAFWNRGGILSGTVALGDAEGFKAALQSYVDSIPPAAEPLSVPFVFKVMQPTWGQVRVKALSVGVREPDNLPPAFLGAKDVTMREDEDLLGGLDLWDHFDDDHQGHDLTYSVAMQENASAVRAEVRGDGRTVDFLTIAPDWSGELAFRFNATDVWGATTTSSNFTVTVEEVNDPPVLVNPGEVFMEEDVAFLLNLSVHDPDLPYGDTLAFEDNTPLFDVDPATGVINVTPLQEDVGTYTVTVVVTDSEGLYHTIQFEVTVLDINDPPAVRDPGLLEALEDVYFSHNFSARDEDGDETFSWRLVGGIGSMYMGPQNGRLTWIPTNEHVGIVNVSVIVTDTRGASDQASVSIEVLNVNDPPEMGSLESVMLTEGERFEHAVSFTDVDLDVDPGEGHTFTVDPPLFEIGPEGLVNFTPTNNHVGTHFLNVTVVDAEGAIGYTLWEVVVLNVNQPPELLPVDDQFWKEDRVAYLVVTASDPDAGDVLTFFDSTSMFDIHPRTGIINFTPTQRWVRKDPYLLEIRVTDSGGESHSIHFEATITATNDPPVVSIRVESLKERLREGDMLSLAAEVDDEDTERYDLSITWYLDGREKGHDDTLVLKSLKGGKHVVELRVSDGDQVVSAEHPFSVEDVKDSFPWGALVGAIVVVVILGVVLVKVVLPMVQGLRSRTKEG